ncbi:MAG TPA: ABC transporter permease [Cellulomonas sp.]
MLRYILQRLGQALVVILGVMTAVFFVMRLSGDPLLLLLPPGASDEVVDQYRSRLGFDQPLVVQYGKFVLGALHGDFGDSLYFRTDAMALLLERFPATVELTVAALAVALAIGIPAGIVAAVWRNSAADGVIRVGALLGQCVPGFWLAMILVIVFAVRLGWVPTSGHGSPAQLILPAVTLGAASAAGITRLLRSSMIEVLQQDYVRVARSKGLGTGAIIGRHALRNAASSAMTIVGLQVAGLLGGSVITETIFAWPGVGRLITESIGNRDYAVVQAAVVVLAVLFVLVNLLIDIAYAAIDPRVRLGRTEAA